MPFKRKFTKRTNRSQTAKPVFRRRALTTKKKFTKKFTKKPASSMLANARSALLNVLTVPNFRDFQVAEQKISGYSSATTGMPVLYFTAANPVSGVVNIPAGSRNPYVMLDIAFKITTAAQQSIKFYQTDFSVQHKISNQSNVIIKLTKYLCMARNDISIVSSGQINPLDLMGDGFANSGIGAGTSGSANSGMVTESLTPFQSPDFCQKYKILKVSKVYIKQGLNHKISLADKKTHTIRPNDFITLTSGQTYATGAQQVGRVRGEQFYIFRIETEQIGDEAAAPNLIGSSTLKVNMVSDYRYEYK